MAENEQFGRFVAQLRKERKMTQKELAWQLGVSDKAVSKWERGLSFPDVALLLPLADIFQVTVTELLRGQRMNAEETLRRDETESLLTKTLFVPVSRKKHQIFFLINFLLGNLALLGLFLWQAFPKELFFDLFHFEILAAVLGFAMAFLFPDTLPEYYDTNSLNFFSNGIVRLHLTGLRFTNQNWIPMLNAGSASYGMMLILLPILALFFFCLGISLPGSLLFFLIGIVPVACMYYAGKCVRH